MKAHPQRDTRGLLEVPENASIIHGEPGFLYKLKYTFGGKPVCFYAAADKSEVLQEFDKRSGEVEVIARPFEYVDESGAKVIHKELMQVIMFEWVKSGLGQERQESGTDIRVVARGYMKKSDLTAVDILKPQKDEHVFSTLPERTHLRQAAMGNCFFVAAIGSIMATDQTNEHSTIFMQKLMVERGDKVIVKLYHPKTLEPFFVAVDKTVLQTLHGRGVASHRELYMFMLEKAFAGAGYIIDRGNENIFQLPEHDRSYYTSFSGGSSGLALTMLTGKKAERIPVNQQEHFQLFAMPPEIVNETSNLIMEKYKKSLHPDEAAKLRPRDLHQRVFDHYEENKKLIEDAMRECLYQQKNADLIDKSALMNFLRGVADDGVIRDQIMQWYEYMLRLRITDPEAYDSLKKMTSGVMSVEQFTRLPQVFAKCKPAVPEKFVELLQRRIDQGLTVDDEKRRRVVVIDSLWGLPISGLYTGYHLQKYDQIKELLDKGHILTAATLGQFDAAVPGLRDQHSYSITGVSVENVGGRDVYYINLRNPWGGTIRRYDKLNYEMNAAEGKDCAYEMTEFAESKIELSDFCRYFKEVAYVAKPWQLEMQNVDELNPDLEETKRGPLQPFNSVFSRPRPSDDREKVRYVRELLRHPEIQDATINMQDIESLNAMLIVARGMINSHEFVAHEDQLRAVIDKANQEILRKSLMHVELIDLLSHVKNVLHKLEAEVKDPNIHQMYRIAEEGLRGDVAAVESALSTIRSLAFITLANSVPRSFASYEVFKSRSVLSAEVSDALFAFGNMDKDPKAVADLARNFVQGSKL